MTLSILLFYSPTRHDQNYCNYMSNILAIFLPLKWLLWRQGASL